MINSRHIISVGNKYSFLSSLAFCCSGMENKDKSNIIILYYDIIHINFVFIISNNIVIDL